MKSLQLICDLETNTQSATTASISLKPAASQSEARAIYAARLGRELELWVRITPSAPPLTFPNSASRCRLVGSRNGAIPVGPVYPLLPVSSGSASNNRTVAGFHPPPRRTE